MRSLLILIACLSVVPLCGTAQRIPEATIGSVQCPKCGRWIKTPGGKIPSGCPYCPKSETTSSSARKTQTQPWTPSRPQLKPIDPFGDYLFYDVPIRPEDGRLKPVHLNPDGLAAEAEATGNEMRKRFEIRQQEQQLKFEMEKEAVLKDRPGGAAMGQFRNVFADDSGRDDAGTVDLRHLKDGTGTVGLLRKPDESGQNEYTGIQREIEAAKYSHMSPGELDELAAQYDNHPEILAQIKRLKAWNQSRDALGSIFDETSRAQQGADAASAAGNRELASATATAAGLVIKVPGVDSVDEFLYGEKTLFGLGGAAAESYIGGEIQDGIVKVGLNDQTWRKLKDPALFGPLKEDSWIGETAARLGGADTLKGVGGMKGVVDGAVAIPELIDYAKALNRAGDHYVTAGELGSQVKAAGGTSETARKWNDARNRSLEESSRLYELIQQLSEERR